MKAYSWLADNKSKFYLKTEVEHYGDGVMYG